ncbi:MAG TPA: ribonuclease Z [Candidatus Sulfotelmatobacter sp.]|nr:ribonuclease Z [Candidatus Sulfotelmatobacter sp.]
MSLRVTFLGTSGAIPTLKRSLASLVIQCGNELLMLDCGEGVQRQMIHAKVGFHKKMKIFLSHLHGDHVLGLPGLLQTMALLDRKKSLDIYGPEGTTTFLTCVQESLKFMLTFDVNVHEIHEEGVVCDEPDYIMESIWANHVTPTFSYSFLEKPRPGKFFPEKATKLNIPKGILWSKLQHGESITLSDGRIVNPSEVSGPSRHGRKIVYSGDTKPFKEFVKFAANADLIIHEATFDDTLMDKAEVDGHSTPEQAALQAKHAKAKMLLLTHISARYANSSILLEQAKKVFENVSVAEDFLVLELPLTE